MKNLQLSPRDVATVLVQLWGPDEAKQYASDLVRSHLPEPKALQVDDSEREILKVLEEAIRANNVSVIDAIVGLRHAGGPNSGRYPKGSGASRPGSGPGTGGRRADDVKMKNVADSMKRGVESSMRRLDEWYRSSDDNFHPITRTEHGYEFGVRDFGSWRVPLDAEGDASAGDFEDYDWEEPTPETAARLDKFVKTHQDKNPDMSISWNTSEKNWIYFQVHDTAKPRAAGGPGSGRYEKGSGGNAPVKIFRGRQTGQLSEGATWWSDDRGMAEHFAGRTRRGPSTKGEVVEESIDPATLATLPYNVTDYATPTELSKHLGIEPLATSMDLNVDEPVRVHFYLEQPEVQKALVTAGVAVVKAREKVTKDREVGTYLRLLGGPGSGRYEKGSGGNVSYKSNDRVTVSDGPGFTHGRGTVIAFHKAQDSKHIDLVEVALDDDDSGDNKLFPASIVKLVGDSKVVDSTPQDKAAVENARQEFIAFTEKLQDAGKTTLGSMTPEDTKEWQRLKSRQNIEIAGIPRVVGSKNLYHKTMLVIGHDGGENEDWVEDPYLDKLRKKYGPTKKEQTRTLGGPGSGRYEKGSGNKQSKHPTHPLPETSKDSVVVYQLDDQEEGELDTHVERRADGSYYASADSFDFQAKDADEMRAKLRKYGATYVGWESRRLGAADQPRDPAGSETGGQWSSGGSGSESKTSDSKGTSTGTSTTDGDGDALTPAQQTMQDELAKQAKKPVRFVKTAEEAVELILAGENVEITDVKDVHTVLKKLGELAIAAKNADPPGSAPNFDPCSITVSGASLFCTEKIKTEKFKHGVPRIEMPQFKSKTPVAGSEADKLPRKDGEVDATAEFKKHLEKAGVKTTDTTMPSRKLKASQAEMEGSKVAGMMLNEKFDPKKSRILVSRDGYVIDGHHTWAAAVGRDAEDGNLDNDMKMDVTVVDLPMSAVYHLSKKWTKEFGMPPAAVKKH